jgi:Beta propeller domain
MRTIRTAAVTVAATAFLAACQTGGDAAPRSTSPSTSPVTTAVHVGGPGRTRALFEPFDSCDSLLAYFKDTADAQVTAYGLGPSVNYPMMDGAPMTTVPGVARAEDGAAAPATTAAGSSSTNTQESDVDEGDIVENDGHYMYVVVDGRLRVVDVGQASQVAAVDLPAGNSEIVLAGDRLVVVTGGYQSIADVRRPRGYAVMPAQPSEAAVSVFDVSDPTEPSLLGRTDLEGSSLAVRASDGVVRVVVRSSVGDRLPLVAPTSPSDRSTAKALALNKDAIAGSTIADWLPRSYEEAADGMATGPSAALDCSKVGRPDVDGAGLAMTWVASVDLRGAPHAVGSAGVVAGGSTVYATTDTLYVATPRVPEPQSDSDVQNVRTDPPTTLVHSFGLSGTNADYQASGEVAGWLLNQYAMSALDGNLRVATTEDADEFGSARSSSVRVLHRDGDQLVESGAVTGLGKGERIYAVRFVGPLAYVVTFRQTDPLYVIDLHDVNHPAQVGELKIPGYSAYLHPIDDGLLLGIGQAASDNGRTRGTKLSLFDVRDPSAPAELATVDLGTASSTAEYDPHAFLWWPDTRQVVVPIMSDGMNIAGPSAEIIAVGTDSLAVQGRLTPEPEMYGRAAIVRSSVVAGELVTVSDVAVQITALDSLQTRATVTFG